ncbi:helicase associated domain-containing protein [Streptomyces sp. enrichment culture]|uniref:helicase associated domain-containing protein n=1 Tax=Streptomyces sp. enrichment culture TaxID=1795815 RepID=UPI003F5509FD
MPQDYRAPDQWAGTAGFPLGVWIADQRRYYNAGDLDAGRVEQLEALGMVWSHHDIAWEQGIAVARSYTAAHGHFLPPTNAVWEGFPIGVWAKNQRAAARRTLHNAERRAAGETVPSGAGEPPDSRMEALEALDPAWCPTGWDIAWQRTFHLTRTHLAAGGTLPHNPGQIIAQGEDLGAWVKAQRHAWDTLLPAQQWLLKSVLGLQPAEDEAEQPKRRSQDERWNASITAARQFYEREGHLVVPRHHTEHLDDGTQVRLGTWLNNVKRRTAGLTEARRADLKQLGVKW